jgi:hemerythrin
LEKPEWEIAWSDFLSVGVPEMDDEHRQFISRVNELNRAIIDSEGKAAVQRRMNLMLAQATEHFAHEEELLGKVKFPLAADHSVRHLELTAQFGRVMKEFEQTDVSYIWALKGLHLSQLLIEHLLKEDMQYRDFIRGREDPTLTAKKSRWHT